ncbi:hypothetical protein BC829DRAFT_119380 [Chytridium lagenaria]|nr:hypothetical protein BC829DRAFT_119380 [Chytridium lagenaria]
MSESTHIQSESSNLNSSEARLDPVIHKVLVWRQESPAVLLERKTSAPPARVESEPDKAVVENVDTSSEQQLPPPADILNNPKESISRSATLNQLGDSAMTLEPQESSLYQKVHDFFEGDVGDADALTDLEDEFDRLLPTLSTKQVSFADLHTADMLIRLKHTGTQLPVHKIMSNLT